jgi:hypothetical protein
MLPESFFTVILLGYGAHTDKTPSGTNPPADCHSISFIGTDRPLELHLDNAAFPSAGHNAYGCGRPDIKHQGLAGVDGLDIGFIGYSYYSIQ